MSIDPTINTPSLQTRADRERQATAVRQSYQAKWVGDPWPSVDGAFVYAEEAAEVRRVEREQKGGDR